MGAGFMIFLVLTYRSMIARFNVSITWIFSSAHDYAYLRIDNRQTMIFLVLTYRFMIDRFNISIYDRSF